MINKELSSQVITKWAKQRNISMNNYAIDDLSNILSDIIAQETK